MPTLLRIPFRIEASRQVFGVCRIGWNTKKRVSRPQTTSINENVTARHKSRGNIARRKEKNETMAFMITL